ncbi:hypothetical protein MNQ96_16260 [Sphingopyxis granuli]|uniref:hypothetical protein n=1 Tax=Sphingopyxis granuli TaxID=267128 RepID=UPI001F52B877|nr:hypothetical protein [Sphingopyxis granuli]UNK79075.1 hypothetical protein MNQ96_16260 [Sphingopyxis granuli]
MANTDIRAESAHNNPSRSPNLEVDFGPLITDEQFEDFLKDRWPGLRMATPIALGMARYGRADLLKRARDMAETQITDDKDALRTMLETIDGLVEYNEGQLEILKALQSRLFVVADDLIIEQGLPSVFAEDVKH